MCILYFEIIFFLKLYNVTNKFIPDCLAVFQLINKNNGNPFDENDLEEAKEFWSVLGDILTIVSKVEQLMSVKSVIGDLENVVNKTTDEMRTNNVHFE